jgi:histone deacetylase 6
MVAGETATETVWQVAMEQSKYWKNIDPKACEPREGRNHGSACVHILMSLAEVEEMAFSIPGTWLFCGYQLDWLEHIRFAEILKAHRQHYLYTQHQMLQVPLMTEELESRFGTQIMCSYVLSPFLPWLFLDLF